MKLKKYKIRFFANVVLNGIRDIEEIPKSYREAVREYIEEKQKEFEREVEEEMKKLGY